MENKGVIRRKREIELSNSEWALIARLARRIKNGDKSLVESLLTIIDVDHGISITTTLQAPLDFPPCSKCGKIPLEIAMKYNKPERSYMEGSVTCKSCGEQVKAITNKMGSFTGIVTFAKLYKAWSAKYKVVKRKEVE